MILKFKGGVWNGITIEADVAPQFINLHGMMHKSVDSPEIAETLLMSDQSGTKYHILESDDESDHVVEYGPAE